MRVENIRFGRKINIIIAVTYRNGTRPKQIAMIIDNVRNYQSFAGQWRKIKGPKDKLSGPL